MNESIVQTTKFDQVTDQDFLWQMYLGSHPLADFTPENQQQATVITNFVCQYRHFPGTTITIDSFLIGPQEFSIYHAYELEAFQPLWQKTDCTIIPTIWHVPPEQHDRVIAVGTHSFKYMTVEKYVEAVEHLLTRTKPGGHLIVCLPKLHFQYHRLRYQPQDIITEVNKRISGKIVNSLDTAQNFYLDIEHE